MKSKVPYALAVLIFLGAVSSLHGSSAPAAGADKAATSSAQAAADQAPLTRSAREEKAIQDARRQKIVEKEAALAAKEEELKKLAAKIENQLKTLEDTKKKYDEIMKTQAEQQKKLQGEKIAKMAKLFKTVKAEQAGKLMDGLPEQDAIILLDRLDTKTVAKLVPHINQPRLLKWIDDNLNIKK
jgi:flagellar motility protein MotE (MotC chaperone)